MNIQPIKELLTGKSIVVDSRDSEIVSRATETANTIINRSDRHKNPRSDEMIYAHSLEGTIREYAVLRLVSGLINEQIPDFTTFNRNTFAWDVFSHGCHLEIKPQKGKNFNISDQTKTTLVNNKDYYDYIVTVEIVQMNEDIDLYRAIPRMLIRSDHFAKFVRKSQFPDKYGRPTWWYSDRDPNIKLN